MKLSFLPIVIFCAAQSWAALPPSLKSGRLQLDGSLSHFTTDANYDNNGGSFEKIDQGRSYTKTQISTRGHYSIKSNIAFWGQLDLASANSVNTDFDRTNTDISDIHFGFQYRFTKRPVVITPELSLTAPIFTYDETSDDALISEGVLGARAGVWLSKKLSGLNFYTYTAVEHRGDGRSMLFHWDLGAHWRTGMIYLGAEIGGFASMNDDEDFAEPSTRLAFIEAKNGGSFKYGYVNPEVLDADFWLGWRTTKKSILRFGYNQTLNGKNYAAGSEFNVAYRIYFDTGPKNKKRAKRKRDSNEFVPDSEKFDEELFEDTSEQDAVNDAKEDKLIEELSD